MRFTRAKRLTAVVLGLCLLAGCASRPAGLMRPVTAQAQGASHVEMLVATTRRSTPNDPGTLFSGERGRVLSFASIGMSIPPDHKVGEIEWPSSTPGDPARNFVVTDVTPLTMQDVPMAVRGAMKRAGHRHVLIFVHGYNNLFDDAVYRFAQISHDSAAPVVPVLFTWPSRGKLLAYPYDRESANYSRDALEDVLNSLVKAPDVQEISILAHSMGNWVAIEALRQYAIRHGQVSPKIRNVMLAAPDVDVDVARSALESMGPHHPNFTLFVSQDDRALKFSRRFWGNTDRLGAINPEVEPYKTALERYKIDVVDLTKLKTGDPVHHAKFAEAPDIVKSIGTRLAQGQDINTRSAGLGDTLGGAVAGAAATVGQAAGLAIAAPIAVVDPVTRANLSEQTQDLLPQKPSPADIAPVDGPITPSQPEGQKGRTQ